MEAMRDTLDSILREISREDAPAWIDKRLADAETARQRGMFDIEAAWRADAKRIAEKFCITA